MVNVYSPCSLAGKRKLWGDLVMTKRGFGMTLWCIGGDFNIVANWKERKGKSKSRSKLEVEEFNTLIHDMKVKNVVLWGKILVG